jgi:hypothetical protein
MKKIEINNIKRIGKKPLKKIDADIINHRRISDIHNPPSPKQLRSRG